MALRQESIFSIVGLATVLIVSHAPRAAEAKCAQVDKLSLQLPRPIQPEYAGFVVPTAEGVSGAPSFSDECLEVKVQGGGMGFDPLQELKDGKVDLAIAEGSYVAQKIASGDALTVVAGYYQKNGLVWIGMNKSHYPSLQALSLKKAGVWCCGYDLALPAITSKASKPISTSIISQNTLSMQQLLSGDLDLASAMVYDELGRLLQVLDNNTNFLKQKSDLYVLDPESYGITLVHNVLVVETSKLANMRQKIVRFLRVVTKTWNFCRMSEAACASVFSEYGVATPHHLWQMREINRFIFPALSGYGLGVLSLERWVAMNDWLVASGVLSASVGNGVVDNTLALDAGALDDITQWTPSSAGNHHFCAEYGSIVHRLCSGHEHVLCPSGQEPAGPADHSCKQCSPGRYAPTTSRMNTCLVCPPGRFSRTSGQSECDLCQPGRVWASATIINASQADCTRCPVGHFANDVGMTECMPCGQGTVAGKEGASECERCPFGHYADTTARTGCKSCKEHMATMTMGTVSLSECVCPEGSYQRKNSAECLPCPEGMTCNVNSMETTLLTVAGNPVVDPSSVGEFPRLRPGYFSMRSSPFTVYLCKDEQSCPGNLPERCGSKMKGLACGQCEAGYYRDGHQCLECTSTDKSPFNYPLLQVIFGPILVCILYYFMRNASKDWGSWWNELASCTFTLCVCYQIIGLFVFTFTQYPAVLASVLMPMTYLVDIPNMLRLSCSEYADFRNSLIVKETAPALFLAIVAMTYGISWCMAMFFQLFSRREDDFGVSRVVPLQANVVFNLYFSVFITFYLTICFIALQLFMCYEHPNGDWSLLFGPEVICYSSVEWNGMVAESVFAILGLIVAPILGFSHVVWRAPMRFQIAGFRERWKFLFIKFKPESFWWGIFHMLRTLMLCLTLVFSQKGNRQMYYMLIVLLIYLAALVIRFPWRHRSTNLFDLFVTCALLFFCALSSSYSRRHGWIDDSIATFATAVTFSPIIGVVALILWVMWCRMNPGNMNVHKVKRAELATSCRAVFAKFVGLQRDKAQGFVQDLSAQDRDVLRDSCAVIVAELLGHQPGSTGLPWRLVHQEPKSGARTWCPGNAGSNAA